MNYRMTMTGLLAAAALALTGCGASYQESGVVLEKEIDKECKGGKCHTELEIDLIRNDGSTVEVKAHSRTDFDRCSVGESFPACVKGGK